MPRPGLLRYSPSSLLAVTFLGVCSGLAPAQQAPKAIPVEQQSPPKALPVQNLPPKSTGPDEDLFEYAMLAYGQKDFAIAIKPLSDYVKNYPTGKRAADAWFRLGECYLKTNQMTEAASAYNQVMARFPKSESAGAAAYRLGAMAYNNRDFATAARLFDTSEHLTTVPEIKLVAMHNKALAYKVAGQKSNALAAYKALLALPPPNQYHDTALQEVANLALELGKTQDALEAYNEIIASTKDESQVTDALITAGALLNDLGKHEAAIKDFKRALNQKGMAPDKRGKAVMGLIQAAYSTGDFQGVVDTYNQNPTALPPEELRAKELFLVGMAHKRLKQYRQAVGLFLTLEKTYPESSDTFEGGYQKLLCFYQLEDKDFPEFCDHFVDKYAGQHPEHDNITMAKFLKADWYFGKADYKKSADAFSGLDLKKIPEALRSSAAYRKGFAEAEAGVYADAASSLTYFITQYPKDGNVAIALAQRGICYKSERDFTKALADFDRIIKEYPENAAAEMAYYQKGSIQAETRDSQGMITTYEALVEKFPKSKVAPECYYRIGQAYFELKEYAKSIEPNHKAVALDGANFADKSYPFLISAQYLLQNVDETAKEVDAYLSANNHANIAPTVLKWLGFKYFDRNNFRFASRYLRRLSTPSTPENTEPVVWFYLGMALVEINEFTDAVEALNNYLNSNPTDSSKSKALLYRGRALRALMKYVEAEQSASDGLKLEREGRLHAELSILQGDIAMDHGNALEKAGDAAASKEQWRLAAANYVLISQIFVDPQLTPEALDKAAEVLEKLGEKEKADNLREQLKTRYPTYKRKE